MAPGFSFPPPPPPPPRASSSGNADDYSQYQSQGQRGGRGGRGARGRGGSDRGRGGSQPGFQQRGGFSHGQTQYHSHTSSSSHGYSERGHSGQDVRDQQPFLTGANSIPSGPHINPTFGAINSTFGAYSPPKTVYQDRSYGSERHAPPPEEWNYGQKRKRDLGPAGMPNGAWKQDQGGIQPDSSHPMKKPASIPKAQVAPAVPSFGAPLPLPATAPIASARRPPRSSAGLGLVPRSDEAHYESEDEDVDEEAAASAQSAGPITIDVNGEVLTLSNTDDVRAWIEERKRRWPSSRRIEEKKQEVRARMDERRRIEAETRAAKGPKDVVSRDVTSGLGMGAQKPRREQRDHVKAGRESHKARDAPGQQQSGREMSLDETKRELERQMKKVEELQKRLAEGQMAARPEKEDAAEESEAPDVAKSDDLPGLATLRPEAQSQHEHEDGHLAPAMSDSIRPPATQVAGPETASDAPSTPSSTSSTSSLSESEGDSAPEEEASKLSAPLRVAPARRDERRVCRSFASTGQCRFGEKCHFRHDVPDGGAIQAQRAPRERPEPARKTLFQRMVEQEQDAENALALQAVKHLGHVGFFSRLAGAVDAE